MSDEVHICGEVGTAFREDDVPVYTEPCVFLIGHDEPHSWAIREAQEEALGIAPGTYRPDPR